MQAVVVTLALGGSFAATATAHAQAKDDATPSETTPVSSEQSRWSDFSFDVDKLDVNVYGLAYHPDREKVKRENLDNEFNPGLGLHYRLRDTKRGTTFTEVGAYYDSGENWAKFLALGYQFKVGENWKIGGAVAAVHSKTYNHGVVFVGMFPLVTYDFGPVKVNAVYFPKVANYNEVAAFGLYVSVPLGQFFGDSAKSR